MLGQTVGKNEGSLVGEKVGSKDGLKVGANVGLSHSKTNTCGFSREGHGFFWNKVGYGESNFISISEVIQRKIVKLSTDMHGEMSLKNQMRDFGTGFGDFSE